MAQRDLRRVQRAAERMEQARGELRDAILAAHRTGESYRDIAQYAGLAHSRVAELAKEARELEQPGDAP
jgi:phosphoribosylcarboxyaminoimidazole (NCAIR) mutase